MEKPQIAVIGAGLMGHGIAYLFAAGGYDVRVQDPASGALEKLPQRIGDICDLLGTDRAAAERVSTGQSIEWAAGGAGIVIEAAPEKLALKQTIFADLAVCGRTWRLVHWPSFCLGFWGGRDVVKQTLT
jgi:3-hydroxybutyryl-CoA dehydrogenase